LYNFFGFSQPSAAAQKFRHARARRARNNVANNDKMIEEFAEGTHRAQKAAGK